MVVCYWNVNDNEYKTTIDEPSTSSQRMSVKSEDRSWGPLMKKANREHEQLNTSM